MSSNNIIVELDDEKETTLTFRSQAIPEIDHACLIYLAGQVDLYNSASFSRKMKKVLQAEFDNIIFQMEACHYISSSGVGAFVQLEKDLKARNGQQVLVKVQPKVFEVIRLLGFKSFFYFASDIPEAIDILDGRPKPDFPVIFRCPICSKRLRASKAGRFRCVECHTILTIDKESRVQLGDMILFKDSGVMVGLKGEECHGT